MKKKSKMYAKGGMAKKKTKMMAKGGMAKKNMMYGGMAKKKMKGGGRAMYGHGGEVMPKAKPC